MPRSGSTLQFNIAWKVAEAGGLGHRVEWRSPGDWAKAAHELEDMQRSPDLHVLKMHSPPESVTALAETHADVRFLYVHRDICDVVYSMKHKFGFSLAQAIRRVEDSLKVETWLLEREAGSVNFQDYALLLDDVPAAVRDVATFEGALLDDGTVQELAAELSLDSAYEKSRQKQPRFEHLRRGISRVLGRKIAFADSELMLHPNHVSEHRGQIGIGQKMLLPNELAAIQDAFGERVSGLADGG